MSEKGGKNLTVERLLQVPAQSETAGKSGAAAEQKL